MFRTNFNETDLPYYKRAIAEFEAKTGVNRLTINWKAFDCYGELMANSYSLHDDSDEVLTLFWTMLDDIKKNANTEMYSNMQYYMEYCEKNEYVTPQDWLEKHKHF